MTENRPPANAKKFSLAGLVAAVIAAFFYAKSGNKPADGTPSTPPSVTAPAEKPAGKPDVAAEAPKPVPQPANAAPKASNVGFTSERSFQDHFQKHGAEFGTITADEYLARAQTLRDAPLSKDVLEIVRDADGVVSRFDKKTGAFLAFNTDKTIRTFFRPNDGEAYFRRQAQR